MAITPWSALDPGDDWLAQLVRSIFPISGSPDFQIGAEQTVIGSLTAQLNAWIMILAGVFLSYSIIVHVQKAAETARVFSESTSSWWPVRITLAMSLMIPMPSGFSVGQAGIITASLWGIGMARTMYQPAIKAIGLDAVPIAQPMIPGTKTIVAGLIRSELCRALINAASGNQDLVPAPQPYTSPSAPNVGGYITWSYSLAKGDETATPICGTVTIRQPLQGSTNVAGVQVDMTGTQHAILTAVMENDIRPVAESVAQQLWQTRQSSAMQPLMAALVSASNDYTAQLTTAASGITQALRSSVQANDARTGNLETQTNQTRLEALGFSGAGAYYLEIARLSGATLSLLSATPVINAPSYQGLGQSLGSDLAPLQAAVLSWTDRIMTYAQTTDGTDVAGGNADLFSGATPGDDGASAIEQIVRKLHLSERVLNAFLTAVAPTNQKWQDPFAALIRLGHEMIIIAISALGAAGLLSSTTGTTAATAFNVLTLNFTGAAATVVGHLLINWLALPIFLMCMSFFVPGLLLAFVLPMIPEAFWLAGIAGWLILVVEAVVGFAMWSFAHITLQGDGLHGRGIKGYEILCSIIFRPSLMLFGLILGSIMFSALSWLLMQTFGVATSFVLSHGWLVTNLLGVVVLLCTFVLVEITFAVLSFRMISLVPHHVIALMAIQPANRVDMDQFSKDVGLVGLSSTLSRMEKGASSTLTSIQQETSRQLGRRGTTALPAPSREAAVDSTLNASADIIPPSEEE